MAPVSDKRLSHKRWCRRNKKCCGPVLFLPKPIVQLRVPPRASLPGAPDTTGSLPSRALARQDCTALIIKDWTHRELLPSHTLHGARYIPLTWPSGISFTTSNPVGAQCKQPS